MRGPRVRSPPRSPSFSVKGRAGSHFKNKRQPRHRKGRIDDSQTPPQPHSRGRRRRWCVACLGEGQSRPQFHEISEPLQAATGGPLKAEKPKRTPSVTRRDRSRALRRVGSSEPPPPGMPSRDRPAIQRGRPGYVIDHIKPLACGAADAPSNMRWQTIAAAKGKDRVERVGCR